MWKIAHLDEMNASLVGGGSKASHVANHAAAKRHKGAVAVQPVLKRSIPHTHYDILQSVLPDHHDSNLNRISKATTGVFLSITTQSVQVCNGRKNQFLCSAQHIHESSPVDGKADVMYAGNEICSY